MTAERVVNAMERRRSARVVRLAPDAVTGAFDAVLFDFRGTLFDDEDDPTWVRNAAASIGRTLGDDEIAAIRRHGST